MIPLPEKRASLVLSCYLLVLILTLSSSARAEPSAWFSRQQKSVEKQSAAELPIEEAVSRVLDRLDANNDGSINGTEVPPLIPGLKVDEKLHISKNELREQVLLAIAKNAPQVAEQQGNNETEFFPSQRKQFSSEALRSAVEQALSNLPDSIEIAGGAKSANSHQKVNVKEQTDGDCCEISTRVPTWLSHVSRKVTGLAVTAVLVLVAAMYDFDRPSDTSDQKFVGPNSQKGSLLRGKATMATLLLAGSRYGFSWLQRSSYMLGASPFARTQPYTKLRGAESVFGMQTYWSPVCSRYGTMPQCMPGDKIVFDEACRSLLSPGGSVCGLVPGYKCRPQCLRVGTDNDRIVPSAIYRGKYFHTASEPEVHSFPLLTPVDCQNLCGSRDCVGWTFDASMAAATRHLRRSEVQNPECRIFSHLLINQHNEPLMFPAEGLNASLTSAYAQPADMVISVFRNNFTFK